MCFYKGSVWKAILFHSNIAKTHFKMHNKHGLGLRYVFPLQKIQQTNTEMFHLIRLNVQKRYMAHNLHYLGLKEKP